MMARVLRTIAAAVAAAVLLVGCGDGEDSAGARTTRETPDDPRLAELEERRDRWDDRGPADYRYTLTLMCFCPEPANQPMVISVTDGEVVTVEPALDTLLPDLGLPLTVDELFDVAAEAIATADRVTIEYDNDFDFPASIEIDNLAEAIDDEMTYVADAFEVA